MNCTRCNAPLPSDARFCRNCGAPISINVPTMPDAPTFSTIPEQRLQSLQIDQPQPQQVPQQQWILPEPQSDQSQAPSPQPYYQPTLPVSPGTMQSTGFAGQPPQAFASRQNMSAPPRRRRGRGLRITLISLIVLIILLAGAWVFALRPYLHSLAQNQLDSALSSAVNQIDFTPLSRAPAGIPIPLRVTEDNINNFYLPLLHVPSSPVQNMHIQITPDEMRLDFTVYGFASDVAGKPVLVNGILTATNVSVGGVAGLVMSSDEMTALLNKHFADIQARLHRPIASVSLINHELDIILG